jgi:hypothetical protein
MDHSIKSFAAFLTESGDWRDRVRLAQIGIGEGLRVLKVRVDWQNLGQKKFDGSLMPYMKCWFYENWPLSTEDDDSWEVYPDRELVELYLNEEPGDVEMVDAEIMEIARDWDADLVWETADNTWLDVQTGEHLGKLHQALEIE